VEPYLLIAQSIYGMSIIEWKVSRSYLVQNGIQYEEKESSLCTMILFVMEHEDGLFCLAHAGFNRHPIKLERLGDIRIS